MIVKHEGLNRISVELISSYLRVKNLHLMDVHLNLCQLQEVSTRMLSDGDDGDTQLYYSFKLDEVR